MIIEKLLTAPTAGQFEQIKFGQNSSEDLWLKLTDNYGNIWVASFASGTNGLEKYNKIELSGNILALINDGEFYLINTKEKKQIFKPLSNYYIDFIINPSRQILCLASFTRIEIYKDLKHLKTISPESIDGIIFNGITDNEVVGQICDAGGEWYDFKLDLNELVIYWQGYMFGYKTKL